MSRNQDLTFEERLLAESFEELLAEMRTVGEGAADGMVLNQLEGLILGKGRDLLRRPLETQMQAAIDASEKKGSCLFKLRRGPA